MNKPYLLQFSELSELLEATVYYMKAGVHFKADTMKLTIELTGGY